MYTLYIWASCTQCKVIGNTWTHSVLLVPDVYNLQSDPVDSGHHQGSQPDQGERGQESSQKSQEKTGTIKLWNITHRVYIVYKINSSGAPENMVLHREARGHGKEYNLL